MTGPHHVQRKAKLRRRARLREWLGRDPVSGWTESQRNQLRSWAKDEMHWLERTLDAWAGERRRMAGARG